ncbi:hypothetical protein H5410_015447 [Solanum commersonii]|uniref:DNA polymerase delta small subunit n=1 Tax=Solanum commersonii TaxID=4109 RepID=A0A9J5ZUI8_SOLCO|nr:hypothetical protein H5410_015447 [Solanum commersonii]
MVSMEKNLLHRKQSLYQSLDENFGIQKEVYRGQQYSQIYFARLHLMRTLLYSLIPNWKPHLPVCTVLGLEEGKDCIIVGTLYKHMKLKPSILDEYSKERSVSPLVQRHNFTHLDDNLVLEDESGRVKLSGCLLPSTYVTGNIIALHGKETSAGEFLVEDVLEAGLPQQIERPIQLGNKVKQRYYLVKCRSRNSSQKPRRFRYDPMEQLHLTKVWASEPLDHQGSCLNVWLFCVENHQKIVASLQYQLDLQGEDKYVVFISGLSVGRSSSNPLQFQLLVDHITGHLGDEKNLGSKDQSRLFEPIKELDILLTQIAASIPLDIMPGSSDPANFSLPQQPLHRCLFPGSSAYNTFRSCTNPHCFELDNIRFLGTSGQNIDDLGKYSEANNNIDFMERTLRWRHLAPTAPNTLGCYPFTDRDPFYVETCPHVYFVGNQDKYESRLIKGSEGQMVMLICIPRFAETGVAVVVSLYCFNQLSPQHV